MYVLYVKHSLCVLVSAFSSTCSRAILWKDFGMIEAACMWHKAAKEQYQR